MSRTIFTEKRINWIIDVWYEEEQEFKQIAKELVQEQIDIGLPIDENFVLDLVDKHVEWELSKKGA